MTARALAALLLGACTAAAQAPAEREPAPLITNVPGRATTSLDGRWQTIVDPFENGYYDYRYQPTPNGYFRVRRPQGPTDLVEYDFDRSPLLAVPGDWNSQRPELLFYEGTVWYRTTFARADPPLGAGRRLFVHFGGANYEARVWLNGTELGVHRGGFTPFDFEVTGLARSGPNDLVVKVDNRRLRDAVPTVNADWWNYGGLTRNVSLVETPSAFVRDYVLQLDPRAPGRARGWVQVDAPAGAPPPPVTVRIPAAGLAQTVTPDASGRAELSLDAARLARWSPERPTLYDVEVATADETVRDRVGFRTVEVRGHEILLNGRPVFLRGISMHEEAPFEGRRAVGREDARTLLGWVKELGGNFVRLAHYPHNEWTTRTADELGVLVWAEIPVYWTIQWENPGTLASARRQLAEMIVRDRNRASVVLWSVANETPRDTGATGPRLAFLRALVDTARALDGTRLVTAALEHRYVAADTILIDDPLGASLDVLGNNEYVGWYDMPLEKADRLVWRSAYDKPLVMSEFGGDAKQGLHGSPGQIWTEEYQERLYERQIAMLRRIPFLAGTSPWILKDFRSPRRPLPGVQDYFNRKGLVSDRGERKRAFFTLQRFYRELERAGR
ncbi:MAG: glycoside hydrolase family 2 protein [Gemmatimonadaceae bacterium]